MDKQSPLMKIEPMGYFNLDELTPHELGILMQKARDMGATLEDEYLPDYLEGGEHAESGSPLSAIQYDFDLHLDDSDLETVKKALVELGWGDRRLLGLTIKRGDFDA